jgi:cold shock CspA family protein
MTDAKKRIALKPHIKQIREWVDAGKADDWIADALGTSASSVQSFRSRNDIYRRVKGSREPVSVFEGVLDHGERDGWGLWFDPSVADDPIWREHWAGVASVTVKVGEDSIILEASKEASQEDAPPAQDATAQDGGGNGLVQQVVGPEPTFQETAWQRGRIKWFDPEKGYGFLVQPSGEDLFVHHSEVEGDASALEPGGEVEYVVGRNERGPNARSVRIV